MDMDIDLAMDQKGHERGFCRGLAALGWFTKMSMMEIEPGTLLSTILIYSF